MTRPTRSSQTAMGRRGQSTIREGRGHRERIYRVHARAECVLCHNPWVEKRTTLYGVQSASPLGVNTPQLNRPDAGDEVAVNQLALFHQLGLLAWTPDLAKLPKLVNPYDESADLDRRARSYLQTNCAHCHQFNAGGSANIDLGYELPLEATKTVGVRPIQGTFNIAGASIISPGDPAGSVLYYRVSKLGGGRMPRIGSNQVDERATRMIHDWIAQYAQKPRSGDGVAKVAPEDRDGARVASASPINLSPDARSAAMQPTDIDDPGALMLLGLIDRSPAESLLRRDVVAIARNNPQVEVRDLFERFIPEGERVKRLGDVIDRAGILALGGDAARGRLVFTANPAAQCKTCHKAGDVGETVGPT